MYNETSTCKTDIISDKHVALGSKTDLKFKNIAIFGRVGGGGGERKGRKPTGGKKQTNQTKTKTNKTKNKKGKL